MLLSVRACFPSIHNSNKHNIHVFCQARRCSAPSKDCMLLLFLNRFPRSSFAWSSLLTTFDTKITCSIKLSGRSSICSSNIASRQQYLPPLMSHLALRRSPGLRLPSPPPGAVSRQRPAAGRGSRGRALRKAGGARGLRAAGAGRRSVTGSRFVDGKPCELRLCLALRVQHVNVGLLSFMVRFAFV